MPVLARVDGPAWSRSRIALPIAVSEPEDRLIACLKSALRVRSQHAAVIRRAHSVEPAKNRAVPFTDLIEHATVLCIGRGRNYPALTTAIGERVGLIGAMSVETAGRYLNAREIDGIAIGDGFSPRVVEALLTVLGEDVRFRDLPVGLLGRAAVDDDRLANLVRVESDPELLAERLIPFVRLQAFESRLQRILKSLDSEGVVDPETGLLGRDAFWRDLDRAVQQAEEDGGALTIARFSFDDMTDMRCSIDAARLFSRLMRNIDFACREQDGSIIAAFTETDLRNAHVVARRIAGILRNTMMSPDLDRRTHQADGDAGDAQADRQSEHAGGARRHLSQGCRKLIEVPKIPPLGGTAHVPTADRCRVRRGLPLVLCGQALSGTGDRAQAGDPGRGAVPALSAQSLGSARRHEPRGLSRHQVRLGRALQRQQPAHHRYRRQGRPRLCPRQDQAPAQHDRLPPADRLGRRSRAR